MANNLWALLRARRRGDYPAAVLAESRLLHALGFHVASLMLARHRLEWMLKDAYRRNDGQRKMRGKPIGLIVEVLKQDGVLGSAETKAIRVLMRQLSGVTHGAACDRNRAGLLHVQVRCAASSVSRFSRSQDRSEAKGGVLCPAF